MFCFFAHSHSNFSKSYITHNIFVQKIMGIKNVEFNVDFNLVDSDLKQYRENIFKEKHMKKVQTWK